jgi:hypothetical protein
LFIHVLFDAGIFYPLADGADLSTVPFPAAEGSNTYVYPSTFLIFEGSFSKEWYNSTICLQVII